MYILTEIGLVVNEYKTELMVSIHPEFIRLDRHVYVSSYKIEKEDEISYLSTVLNGMKYHYLEDEMENNTTLFWFLEAVQSSFNNR